MTLMTIINRIIDSGFYFLQIFPFRIYLQGAERMTTSRAKLPSISTSWRCCHAACHIPYCALYTATCSVALQAQLICSGKQIFTRTHHYWLKKKWILWLRVKVMVVCLEKEKKSPTFLTVVYYLVWNAGKVLKYFWQLKLAWSLWRWTGGQSPLQCSYWAQDSHLRHDSTRRQCRVNGGSTVRSERQEHLDKIQKNTFRVPALFRDVMFKHLLLSGCSPVSVPLRVVLNEVVVKSDGRW